MTALREIAAGMTRIWVALYTLGLPTALRDGRRAEIDSDLYEQRHVAALAEEPPGETASQLFARLLLGIPADILWRLEAGRAAASQRRPTMNESLTMRALALLGLAAASFPLVIGILVVTGVNGEMSDSERWIFGPVQMAVGCAIVTGILVSARRPVLGIALTAAGTIAISVMWYWMAVITAPIGIALTAIAYFRGRGTPGAQPRGTGTA